MLYFFKKIATKKHIDQHSHDKTHETTYYIKLYNSVYGKPDISNIHNFVLPRRNRYIILDIYHYAIYTYIYLKVNISS